MIQQKSLLCISLRSRFRRRAIVAIYYGYLVLLAAIACWKHKFLPYALITQTLNLGAFFGGIRSGGPVKPYSDFTPEAGYSGVQELNLAGIRTSAKLKALDEREVEQRNEAHYTAYRILRWTICIVTALFLIGIAIAPKPVINSARVILWFLTIFVLSLPQSVILWTEPEPLPEGDLTLIPHP